MSLNSAKLINGKKLTVTEYLEYGLNILEGNYPVIKNLKTGELPVTKITRPNCVDPTAARICTDVRKTDEHIDILCESATITYDIGYTTQVDTVYVCGGTPGGYTLADFEIFASETEADLYNDSNLIYHQITSDECMGKSTTDNYQEVGEWIWSVKGSCRYFGIKVNKANFIDDIIRIGQIALFEKSFSEDAKYLRKKYPTNLLNKLEPVCLTDSILNKTFAQVDGEKTFTFNLKYQTILNNVIVISDENLEISIENMGSTVTATNVNGHKETVFTDELLSTPQSTLSVTVKGKGKVYQVIAYNSFKSGGIDFNNIINNDFLSIGVNIMPMAFMQESLDTGYNEVYWELEKCRIRRIKPTVARMWFQLDWVVDNYEDYKSGNCNFNSAKMQSVYKYLDIFKEVGTEIEFDYGWKMTEETWPWFCFPTPKTATPHLKSFSILPFAAVMCLII